MNIFFRSSEKHAVGKLARERKTVTAMLRIYCRAHHGGRSEFCAACAELHAYAMCRLDRCPFGEQKPTCAACPIHCYKADRRQQIREVMKYAGPRMLWHHPLSALRHLWDGRRTAEQSPRKNCACLPAALQAADFPPPKPICTASHDSGIHPDST